MRSNIYSLFTALLVFGSLCTTAQTISTYAGNGIAGFAGDGTAATSAGVQLSAPCGTAVDATGNVYIADAANKVVRKVNATTGIITTFAGTSGIAGTSGDGGQASVAKLTNPVDVVTDASGNVYIVDNGGNNVRKVDGTGVISTVAGSSSGMAGMTGDGGPANAALLSAPMAIAIDGSGKLFIADYGNSTVRAILSGNIYTIAGTPGTSGYGGDGAIATTSKLSNPMGVAVDAAGNVYIADAGNYRIRQIKIADGKIYTYGGNGTKGFLGDGGAAASAKFDSIQRIALDATGNLYIADRVDNRIRKISGSSYFITTVAGNGVAGSTGDGSPASACELNTPTDIAFDASGSMYIADMGNNKVRKTGAFPAITVLGGTGTICTAATSTLSDATPGGTWSSSTTTIATVGSSSGIVTGVAAGTATISYKTPTDAAVKTVTVVVCTSHVGVSNTQTAINGMKVFPNPNDGTFNIAISSEIDEPATITITNVMGQKLRSVITQTNKQTDLQLDAPSGIYMINASTPHGRWSEKITIVR